MLHDEMTGCARLRAIRDFARKRLWRCCQNPLEEMLAEPTRDLRAREAVEMLAELMLFEFKRTQARAGACIRVEERREVSGRRG
jgi:ketopantoate reductase